MRKLQNAWEKKKKGRRIILIKNGKEKKMFPDPSKFSKKVLVYPVC